MYFLVFFSVLDISISVFLISRGLSSSFDDDSISSQPSITPTKLNEEIFQNTEHIKNIIAQENFEPNYETKDELILPLTEIILSILLSVSTLIAIFVIRKLSKKQKELDPILISTSSIDYFEETQKLLNSATILYNSNKVKDLINNKTISGGMIPKIENCLDVASNGVKGVCIIDGRLDHSILFELLSNAGSGTLIRK